MKMFDEYEIHPCIIVSEHDYDQCYEQVDPSEPIQADIWSLYGHILGEGILCISDQSSYEAVNEIYCRITGRDYGLSVDECSPEMRLSYHRKIRQ